MECERGNASNALENILRRFLNHEFIVLMLDVDEICTEVSTGTIVVRKYEVCIRYELFDEE